MKTLLRTDLTGVKEAVLFTLEKGLKGHPNVTEDFLKSRIGVRDFELDAALYELLDEGRIITLWVGHRMKRRKCYALPERADFTAVWSVVGDSKLISKVKVGSLLTVDEERQKATAAELEQSQKQIAEATAASIARFKARENRLISDLSDEWSMIESTSRQSISAQADGQKGEAERAAFLKQEYARLVQRRRRFFADNYKSHFRGQEIPAELLNELAPLAEVVTA